MNQTTQLYTVGVVALLVGFLLGLIVASSWGGDSEPNAPEDDGGVADEIDETDENGFEEGGSSDENGQSADTNESEEVIADRSPDASVDEEHPGNPDSRFLEVGDQTAGESVAVSRVVADTPVWVAVSEEQNGGMGNILGAKWLPAGDHSDETVELLRGTETGEDYFVTLYKDNGDKEFNHRQDTLMQVDGSTIYVVFSTTQ